MDGLLEKRSIKLLMCLLFSLVLTSCASLKPDLFPEQPVDPDYTRAHQLISEFFTSDNYTQLDVSDIPSMERFAKQNQEYGGLFHVYQLNQNCDCNRIIAWYVYFVNKNRMHVNFNENSPIFHSRIGKKKIKLEQAKIKYLMKDNNLNNLTLAITRGTVR